MSTTWLTDNETTFIKVCGLRQEESVDVAVGSGAHAIGFVFVPSSPRYIEREDAEWSVPSLDMRITRHNDHKYTTELYVKPTHSVIILPCD